MAFDWRAFSEGLQGVTQGLSAGLMRKHERREERKEWEHRQKIEHDYWGKQEEERKANEKELVTYREQINTEQAIATEKRAMENAAFKDNPMIKNMIQAGTAPQANLQDRIAGLSIQNVLGKLGNMESLNDEELKFAKTTMPIIGTTVLDENQKVKEFQIRQQQAKASLESVDVYRKEQIRVRDENTQLRREAQTLGQARYDEYLGRQKDQTADKLQKEIQRTWSQEGDIVSAFRQGQLKKEDMLFMQAAQSDQYLRYLQKKYNELGGEGSGIKLELGDDEILEEIMGRYPEFEDITKDEFDTYLKGYRNPKEVKGATRK